MVLHLLAELRNALEKETDRTKEHDKQINAIDSIRSYLDQIDFNAETISLANEEKFTHLLSSLKGKSLIKEEKKVIQELMKRK